MLGGLIMKLIWITTVYNKSTDGIVRSGQMADHKAFLSLSSHLTTTYTFYEKYVAKKDELTIWVQNAL